MIYRCVLHGLLLLCLSTGSLLAAEEGFQSATFESATFDSDGVKIHYLSKGQGEPVVLIHGYTRSAQSMWIRSGFANALAKRYRILAIDCRGHGQSDKPHDPKQYGSKMAGDVIRLLDHLKIDRAHVVGYSMGGFITMKVLTEHPRRVRSAMLGGAGWMRLADAEDGMMVRVAEALERGEELGPLIRGLTPAGKPEPTEDQIKMTNALLMLSNDAKALAAVARGLYGLAVTEEKLRANTVPTMVVVGEVDPLKRGVDRLPGVMKNLKIKVLAGEDHITAARSREFLAEIQGFLGGKKTVSVDDKRPVSATDTRN